MFFFPPSVYVVVGYRKHNGGVWILVLDEMASPEVFLSPRYELQQRGLLHEEDSGVVPDIYSRNSDLDSEVKFLKQEVNKFRNAAL